MARPAGKPAETAQTAVVPAQGQTPAKPGQARDPIVALMERMRPAIMAAVPRHVDGDRMVRVWLTTVRQNPTLRKMATGKEEERNSLLAAMLIISQLGLEPGPLGQASIVPFYNSKAERYEAQAIIEYKGYLALARRSGEIESVHVEPVYPEDEFDYQLGLEPRLHHKPNLQGRKPDSKPWCYYGVVKFRGGGHQIHVMTIAEIEQYRQRSRAANSGPWVTDYDAMARKTVIRRMWRWLPVSAEIQRAAALDEAVGRGVSETGSVDISPGYDPDSGEVITVEGRVIEDEQEPTGGQAQPKAPGQAEGLL